MKKIACLIMTIVMGLSLCACGNKTVFDTTYTYNYAIIELPNGDIVEGDIQTWNDYDDGDQIQVKIDEVIYLVHSSDTVLMKK